MKFSGKMWVMIVLKVTKYQALNLSLEDTFSEKPLTEEVWEGRGERGTYVNRSIPGEDESLSYASQGALGTEEGASGTGEFVEEGASGT